MAVDFADLSHTPIFGQISSNPVLRNTSHQTVVSAPTNADPHCFQPLPRTSTYGSENCSTPSQMTMLRFGTICSSRCRAFRPQRSRVMKKQRGVTQAEKEFDAEVAKFNQEARKIMDDRSLSMSARRRLISLKGKALLRPSASNSQSTSTP
jgi:hypothetical protein